MAARNPIPTDDVGVVPVSDKVTSKSGKEYYKQPAPEKRANPKYRKEFYLRGKAEADAFDADARANNKTSVGYLRWLWNEDRKRRGLPEWTPEETEPPQ